MTLEQKLSIALKSNNEDSINSIFEEIYSSYGKLVYFIIMQYINNKLDVEELTQDVFISFFNNLDNNNVKNIKYYLVTSAKNKALDFLKSKKDSVLLDENIIYQQLDTKYSSYKYIEIIEEMKSCLTNFEIDLIIKHNIYGITFKEMSKIYNKSINTLLTTYHRAIKKFKERKKNNEKWFY